MRASACLSAISFMTLSFALFTKDSQVHALLNSEGNDALCPVRSWVWELSFSGSGPEVDC